MPFKTFEIQMLMDFIKENQPEIKRSIVYLLSKAASDEKPAPINTATIYSLYCLIDELN
jgi:hypothetical protein